MPEYKMKGIAHPSFDAVFGGGAQIDKVSALNGTLHALKATAKDTGDMKVISQRNSPALGPEVREALYSESVSAKIWGVALRGLRTPKPPTMHPEYTRPGGRDYVYSGVGFWTAGFFPGCLALLYERQRLWPLHGSRRPHMLALQHATQWWTATLHEQSTRCDTHDLGFMIQPWAELGWRLDSDQRYLRTLISAARSLASRFDSKVGCIRSWDICSTQKYSFVDKSKNFLVIIDNMMNLDLLYHAAELTGDQSLADMATTHALTSMKAHVRDDNSTCHVADFDPTTGKMRARLTNQGYSDTSCWTRGQAWGITGFVQVYHRTHDEQFLDTSKRLAEYFMARLSTDFIPDWDFDAPKPGPKDTSAALVAVYGMLLLHEAEASLGRASFADGYYLNSALRMLAALIESCLSPAARFFTTSSGDEEVDLGDGLETIIMHATINNFEYAPRRWADHGLVYADYFFLLIGNKLLKMGLV